MNALQEALKQFFGSKKLMAAIVGMLLIAAQKAGLPMDQDTLYEFLAVIGTFLLSQGIADMGKPAAQLQIDSVGAVQTAQIKVARLEAEQAVAAAKRPTARPTARPTVKKKAGRRK